MSKYINDFLSPQPQTVKDEYIPEQVKNHAGGYVYATATQQAVRRFLVLGAEGPTYYADQKDHMSENFGTLQTALRDSWAETLGTIVKVSEEGLAAKVSPTLFALALAYTSKPSNGDYQYIYSRTFVTAFGKVVRTMSHLQEFLSYVKLLKGSISGKGTLGKAVNELFSSWGAEKFGYQGVKYRTRNGFAVRDILRIAHPKTEDRRLNNAYAYFAGKDVSIWELPASVTAYEGIRHANRPMEFLRESPSMAWEMLPTEMLTDKETWEIILPNMPLTAMVRNLGRMTALGVFDEPANIKVVRELFNDIDAIKKARIHPYNVLVAIATYGQGHGDKGKLKWLPQHHIYAALCNLYYLSFMNSDMGESKVMVALDVSGSMGSALMGGPLSMKQGAVCMAQITMMNQLGTRCFKFDTGLTDLTGTVNWNVGNPLELSSAAGFRWNGGGTDCALPIMHALINDAFYDAFVVYTDNETWAGPIKPQEALRRYRDRINPNAKLIVVGMSATPFTIADPNDPNSLDVVGFDSSTPSLIDNFIAGRV